MCTDYVSYRMRIQTGKLAGFETKRQISPVEICLFWNSYTNSDTQKLPYTISSPDCFLRSFYVICPMTSASACTAVSAAAADSRLHQIQDIQDNDYDKDHKNDPGCRIHSNRLLSSKTILRV